MPSVNEHEVVLNRLIREVLDGVYERLANRSSELHRPDGEETTQRYEGYVEGYSDAVEYLRQIVDERQDNDDYRVRRFRG